MALSEMDRVIEAHIDPERRGDIEAILKTVSEGEPGLSSTELLPMVAGAGLDMFSR
jgi:hypothetical protein